MKFEEAIKYLKTGERIKRSAWKICYLLIDKNRIKMKRGLGKQWSYQFKDMDIFADDWHIANTSMFED